MNIKKSLKTIPLLLRCFCIMLILGSLFFRAVAQETDTIVPLDKDPEKILRKIDITEITRNGLTPWKNKFSGHFTGIDFGFNMLLDPDYSGYQSEFMENDVFNSNSAYFNVVQQSFGLQKRKNTFGLVSGLGLQLQSYRLDDRTSIITDDNGVVQPDFLYFDENQKSKFANVYITVPLLIEWQIPINHYDNRFFISTGILGSFRINSLVLFWLTWNYPRQVTKRWV